MNATRVQTNPTVIVTLSLDELRDVDSELARRAAQLGKPKQISRSHRAVLAEIARRSR
jgi:hypothetical protein